MRILVIEDEPLLCQRLEGALQAAGHVVDGTGTGKEGLFLGSEYPIDVLETAGIDMASPEPIESALSVYGERLEDAAELLNLE